MEPLILITGASQGIGAALALEFARRLQRPRLALVARSAAHLQAVQASLPAGCESACFVADVADPEQVAAMALAVQQRFGTPDVLVNNAGFWRGGSAETMPVAEFSAVLQTNLVGLYAVTHAFLPAMIARGSGDIFNMSSTAGLIGLPGNAAYAAAKHGVTGLSKVLRAELLDKGIRVCCVHPGPTLSPSWDGTGVPAERLMPTEDVARAFVDIYQLSRNTVVEEIVLRPQRGDI